MRAGLVRGCRARRRGAVAGPSLCREKGGGGARRQRCGPGGVRFLHRTSAGPSAGSRPTLRVVLAGAEYVGEGLLAGFGVRVDVVADRGERAEGARGQPRLEEGDGLVQEGEVVVQVYAASRL